VGTVREHIAYLHEYFPHTVKAFTVLRCLQCARTTNFFVVLALTFPQMTSYASAQARGQETASASVKNEAAVPAESQAIERGKLPERWCRNGAFLDAIKLMNAASRSYESLQQADATIARAELGAVLAIAIKQASEEYHCVRGTLGSGYDASYAATVKRAMSNAQRAKAPPDVMKTARDLISQIETSGAPRP
jgi:hypothetical protein